MTQLTVEEQQAREKAIDFYRYIGKTEVEAMRLAWRDIQKAFPRLQEFDATMAEADGAAAPRASPNLPSGFSAEGSQNLDAKWKAARNDKQ